MIQKSYHTILCELERLYTRVDSLNKFRFKFPNFDFCKCFKMTKKLLLPIFLLFFTLCGISGSATYGQNNSKPNAPIKFIIVQLRQESNRENAVKASNNQRLLRQLYIDRDSIQKITIRDFNDNFKNCPVYYFNDTNLDKISIGDFNGTLTDGSGKPVSASATDNGKYYVITFGVPSFQMNSETYAKGGSRDDLFKQPDGFYAVINDRNMKQRGYVCQMESASLFGMRRFLRPYSYKSKEFKMSYIRCAHKISEVLRNNPEKIGKNEI